ncbi:dTDP-4-dehydrorhamnose reductase [Devosia naphthalenivorans]|uniref:dTDP-4-dehydrorhamnose reductase n=1 Tax=Devosia naphthalenivorans TaxID=2082392 RepID=UPI000D3AB098|nr:dTDP-4-dehydrorhamnose reductase [Devosia naphthalenivorans]
MRILVIGRDGQLARALAQLNSDALSVRCVGRPELDLLDRDTIGAAITNYSPDVVINPAAYTAVDKAESEQDLAFAVNRDGAEHVAAAAKLAGIPLVHISTDYVFDGHKTSPYVETDTPDPQSVYGCSKLAGEKAVARANPDHVILRTAWVYSPWGHNFAKTMLRLAGEREVVRVVADQHGTPTYAPYIADAVAAVVNSIRTRSNGDWRGLFHLTNEGDTSWADFAAAVFEHSRQRGGPWARVEPIATKDYPTPAKRPTNSRLDTTLFSQTFGYAPPHWREGVRRFSETMLPR